MGVQLYYIVTCWESRARLGDVLNPKDDFLDAPVNGVLALVPLHGAGVARPSSGDAPVPAVACLAGVLGAFGAALGAERFNEARSAAAFPVSLVQGGRFDWLAMSFQGRIMHVHRALEHPNPHLTVPSRISRFPAVFHGSRLYFTVPGPSFTVKFGLPPAIPSVPYSGWARNTHLRTRPVRNHMGQDMAQVPQAQCKEGMDTHLQNCVL